MRRPSALCVGFGLAAVALSSILLYRSFRPGRPSTLASPCPGTALPSLRRASGRAMEARWPRPCHSAPAVASLDRSRRRGARPWRTHIVPARLRRCSVLVSGFRFRPVSAGWCCSRRRFPMRCSRVRCRRRGRCAAGRRRFRAARPLRRARARLLRPADRRSRSADTCAPSRWRWRCRIATIAAAAIDPCAPVLFFTVELPFRRRLGVRPAAVRALDRPRGDAHRCAISAAARSAGARARTDGAALGRLHSLASRSASPAPFCQRFPGPPLVFLGLVAGAAADDFDARRLGDAHRPLPAHLPDLRHRLRRHRARRPARRRQQDGDLRGARRFARRPRLRPAGPSRRPLRGASPASGTRGATCCQAGKVGFATWLGMFLAAVAKLAILLADGRPLRPRLVALSRSRLQRFSGFSIFRRTGRSCRGLPAPRAPGSATRRRPPARRRASATLASGTAGPQPDRLDTAAMSAVAFGRRSTSTSESETVMLSALPR